MSSIEIEGKERKGKNAFGSLWTSVKASLHGECEKTCSCTARLQDPTVSHRQRLQDRATNTPSTSLQPPDTFRQPNHLCWPGCSSACCGFLGVTATAKLKSSHTGSLGPAEFPFSTSNLLPLLQADSCQTTIVSKLNKLIFMSIHYLSVKNNSH